MQYESKSRRLEKLSGQRLVAQMEHDSQAMASTKFDRSNKEIHFGSSYSGLAIPGQIHCGHTLVSSKNES